MSAKSDTPTTTPSFAPELLQQLLAERKTPGEIEDLLKDLRKAFIEHALQGELTHLLGYESTRWRDATRATPAMGPPVKRSRQKTPAWSWRSRATAMACSSRNSWVSTNAVGKALTN